MKKLVVGLTVLMTLTACGGNSPQPANTPQSSTTTPTANPATTPVEKAPVLNAGQLATKMKSAVAAKSVTIWNEDTDKNHLLGRPGGYTSAATLVDKSLPCTDVGVDCGATIEVFATPDEAKDRAEYIKGIKNGGIMGTEYQTVIGSTLLRVTGELPPKTNTKYVAAFKSAMNG